MDVRAVLRELARVYIRLIQRYAAPCDVDIPGGQLYIHVFLFDLLHLEVPAQQIAYRDRKLNIKPPELSIRHIGHGEGVDVQPDYKVALLGRLELFECVRLLGEVQRRASEPFDRKLVHLALRSQHTERRRHVEIQRVVVPEGQRIVLLNKNLNLVHSVFEAAAACRA